MPRSFAGETDMSALVTEAMRTVDAAVKLPEGYRMVWSGRFEDQQRALARLYIIVPLVIFIIFVLLFGAFQSVGTALLIMLNLPFALIGGTFALYLWRTNFNISAAVGYIAVFGVSVLNGVVLATSIRQAQSEGLELDDAIVRGCEIRFRAIVVSAIVAVIGFLPAALLARDRLGDPAAAGPRRDRWAHLVDGAHPARAAGDLRAAQRARERARAGGRGAADRIGASRRRDGLESRQLGCSTAAFIVPRAGPQCRANTRTSGTRA
jgi:hypothetical protein